MLGDIWNTTQWKFAKAGKNWGDRSSVPMKQLRLLPHFKIGGGVEGDR
jgi:hypothetical protein